MRGADSVCAAVRDCWASLYSPEAIAYRARLGDAHTALAMGVAVQLMVDAEVAGVMFTCNPVSGDPSIVAINASWGLGSTVVGGEVTPDEFLISKVTGEMVRRSVNRKEIEQRPAEGGGIVTLAVPDERAADRLPRRGAPGSARRRGADGRAALRLTPGHRVGARRRAARSSSSSRGR